MSIKSIPEKIRYDAATPVFMQGARIFKQAVDIIGGEVRSRNKLRVALCYFEIADSIVSESTNLNHKGLCLKFLRRYDECISTYRRFHEEENILCNEGEAYKELANEVIAYCEEELAKGGDIFFGDQGIEVLVESEFIICAQHFGEAIVDGDYESAFGMLSNVLKQKSSKKKLQNRVKKMIGVETSAIATSVVVNTMEKWQDKKEGEVGWVYLALEGEGVNEGMTLIVSEHFSEFIISDIEWGRS